MEEAAENLTHFDEKGNAVMVDVSEKSSTTRIAVARGNIRMNDAAFSAVREGGKKGDVLAVAQVAGIMACKKTADLIPLCHPLLLSKCNLTFTLNHEEKTVQAECTVCVTGQTGVEMEALTGVSVALLTIYDMCKAVDKTMEIGSICLVKKSGGKSGDFENPVF